MTVHLLNSAVMPQSGLYLLENISGKIFAEEVREAAENHTLRHYIGYRSTLAFVEHVTGISFGETNFKETKLNDGDTLLIVRLKYRVAPYEKKEDNVSLSDFEFFRCKYNLTK